MPVKKNAARRPNKRGNPKRVTRPATPAIFPKSRVVSKQSVPRAPKQPHVHSICSITDPFCVHARGAQRPDGGPPSIPYQIRFIQTVPCWSTTGQNRYIFTPNPAFCYAGSTSASAGANFVVDAAYTATPQAAFVSTNAKEIRLTSFGAIVRSAMTATTAKGLCILSSDPAPVLSASIPPGSMQASESEVITMAAGFEHAWVSKPMGPSAHLFKPYSGFTSTLADLDWTSLVVEISSSDTTNGITALTVEVVMNVEITIAVGNSVSAVSQLTKTPVKPNRPALAAADVSHSNRPSFIQGGIAQATSYLEKAARSALDDVIADGLALLAF